MSGTPNISLIARLKARYDARRATGKTLSAKHFALIGFIVPAVWSGYHAMHHQSTNEELASSFVPGILPSCDSDAARGLLIGALEDAPSAKKTGGKVAKLGDIKETGFVPVNSKGSELRLCTADVFLNVGRHDVSFTLQWTSATKDELWIEADSPF
ncbi:hypothetical protein [Lichenihabitans psoromatis]|uniref:hypothetical protein n=1 Tax=Lichenihabitans psoromatis TaxID=2528642 RepID=UPI0010384D65|nr:hypothetical protein [Lichenihabitans psoromatis]